MPLFCDPISPDPSSIKRGEKIKNKNLPRPLFDKEGRKDKK